MEDSFKGRVDKIFGSLSTSSKSAPSIAAAAPAPLWSLTDDEVERREWNRHKDNPHRDDHTPCSSSFNGLFMKKKDRTKNSPRNKLDDPSDDGDEDNQRLADGEDDDDDWDFRSSIGLDCTLDNEEEEDAYDIMAEGRESTGYLLYMKDVTDHGPYLNSHNVLPSSVDDSPKDPRVNHHAEKLRLEEDEETMAEKLESNPSLLESAFNNQKPLLIARESGVKVKSILKRKNDAAVKSSKRVKFDATCKDEYDQASEKYRDALAGPSSTESKAEGEDSISVKSRVPDYILNPSKYSRYSFDSNDINEESNIQACMDLLGHIRKSNPMALEINSQDLPADHQKSVLFIPRKKASGCKQTDGSGEGISKQSLSQTSSSVGIAAGEVQQDKVCVMQEDEPNVVAACTNVTFQKHGRRYRTKSGFEETSS